MVISLAIGTKVPFYIKRYSASIYNFFMVSQIFWSYIFKLFFDKKDTNDNIQINIMDSSKSSSILYLDTKIYEKKQKVKKKNYY